MEMVALCRIMAILHFKICMPMRWLAGNTHHLGQIGYDWSARSMGKAIDALHDAMVEIEKDGSKLLDEDFMDSIFSEIYEDEDGNKVPLEPLVEAMNYQFKEKQTPALDGSKVLPFDKLNAELFYPDRKENKATNELLKSMAVEVAECMLQELRDPAKATSDYLSSAEGKFSWGETTDEEHAACIGKMATNDPAESPFAALTCQLQAFGRVLGIHASAVGHARINGDFKRDFKDSVKDGTYHKLPPDMRESLLRFALSIAPAIRKAEKTALDKQREAKKKKQEFLRQKKVAAVQREYANAVTYIDMYYSPACWKTMSQARKEFSKLRSKTAKLDAVKEQIRIRVVGFGWDDLHHPWSKGGVDYSPEDLRDHLINKIIPEQANSKRGIPEKPTMNLPSRKETKQLGTRTLDVDDLDKCNDDEKDEVIAGAMKLRETLEEDGKVDRYEKFQPPRPNVDESFVGSRIEQLWIFTEKDGTKVPQWCQGEVIAVKKGNKVHIKWDEECLREGDAKVSQERLLVSKYNKHVEEAWRMDLG
jgi:hypothetical protein